MRFGTIISKELSIGTLLTVCLMSFCLIFLTSLNFFLYPSGEKEVVTIKLFSGSDDTNQAPSGPTEEKSSGNTSFSFAEEIFHEAHPEVNFALSNHLYLHHIAEAEKIQMFHPERISPPPKF